MAQLTLEREMTIRDHGPTPNIKASLDPEPPQRNQGSSDRRSPRFDGFTARHCLKGVTGAHVRFHEIEQ